MITSFSVWVYLFICLVAAVVYLRSAQARHVSLRGIRADAPDRPARRSNYRYEAPAVAIAETAIALASGGTWAGAIAPIRHRREGTGPWMAGRHRPRGGVSWRDRDRPWSAASRADGPIDLA